jgi:hypothetical protein
MSTNWPKSHHGHASEYQVAGWPFVETYTLTGSFKVTFPQSTQWVQVQNLDNSKNLRVGFTENGVNNSHYYLLRGGTTAPAISPVFSVKCKEMWFRGNVISDGIQFSVAAGLTSVMPSDFPTLTGSSGFTGVG